LFASFSLVVEDNNENKSYTNKHKMIFLCKPDEI